LTQDRRVLATARHVPLLLLFAASACAGAPPPPPAPKPAPREDGTTVVKLDSGDGAADGGDRDGDGIGDAFDLCQGQLEDGKGAHPWDGCPDADDPARRVMRWGPSPKQAVKVTRGEIKISEEILFRSGSASIDPASQELLRSIAQVLVDVPEIEIVEIAGHADDSGSDEKNKRLTEQRATSVMADLVSKRIDRARLRAAGYSSYCPIAPGNDDAARAKNRRVELRIVRRDGKNLEPHWAGCAEAERHGMKAAPLPPPAGPKAPTDDRRSAQECSDAQTKPCTKRCDGGDVEACEALANLFGGDDPKRAFDAASKACQLGALYFCTRAAGYLRQGTGVAKDLARAHALVVAACDKGNGRACTDAGTDARLGNAVAKDEAKAAELFLRACDAGDAGGCELLAAAHWTGQGAPKDRRKGFDLHVAGCELGGAASCAAIGASFAEDPAAATRSRGRALAALHVACEQDETTEACHALEAMKEQPGEWQALPVCSAGDFKACNQACASQKSSPACLELGVALLYGTGVRRRSPDALALFTEACREGSAKGCALAALVHAGHNDDPKAERAAAGDFEAACALGDASGCVNHALMELEGLGTYRDEASAAKALDEACEQGVPIACAHLSVLAGAGLGVPKDAARATSLLARACAKGFRPACPAGDAR
jgi:hypothetical protein